MKPIIINENRPALDGKLGNSKYPLRPDNNSTNAQRVSILHWFSTISPRLTTLDAREILGIMSPAPRIGELRHDFGHEIITEWERQKDSTGTLHRVGVYIYVGLSKSIDMEEC